MTVKDTATTSTTANEETRQGVFWNEKSYTKRLSMQLVEINQNILAKEGRIKIYLDMHKQDERLFFQQVGG